MSSNLACPFYHKKLKKRIEHICVRLGIKENQEDLFQEILLKFLENPNSKQTVEHAIIDIMRQQSGRKGMDHYEKKLLLRGAANIDDIHSSKLAYDCFESISQKIDANIHIGKIKDKRLFTIVKLYYVDGYTMLEIADSLELTMARVHQLIDDAIEIMQKNRKFRPLVDTL